MSVEPAQRIASVGRGQSAAASPVAQASGRVLIVDDSAVVRQVLTRTLEREPGLSVMGAVSDPLFAMQRMEKDWPDALVLDIEMPRMDGITFLRKLMAERPLPVVVCSTLTGKGTETCMQALSAGAFAVVEKPTQGLREFLTAGARQLVSAVQAAVAARARAGHLVPSTRGTASTVPARVNASAAPPAALARTTERVVAIGTSTGGTQALERVLLALPRVSPGIVVVQHMPEKFTASFAARLDSLAELEVREAVTGDRVVPGRVLIAPGGRHLRLTRSGALYQVEVVDGPPVNRHRPSVDVLFRSVAKVAGSNALGILMTGMGDDGARGLLEMRQCGADTIAQDEASCVVFGMPKEAIRLGAAARVMPLDSIPAAIRPQ